MPFCINKVCTKRSPRPAHLCYFNFWTTFTKMRLRLTNIIRREIKTQMLSQNKSFYWKKYVLRSLWDTPYVIWESRGQKAVIILSNSQHKLSRSRTLGRETSLCQSFKKKVGNRGGLLWLKLIKSEWAVRVCIGSFYLILLYC